MVELLDERRMSLRLARARPGALLDEVEGAVDSEALYLRVSSLLALGRYGDAADAFRSASGEGQLDPSLAALGLFSECLAQRRLLEDVRASLQRITDGYPGLQRHKVMLAMLHILEVPHGKSGTWRHWGEHLARWTRF